MQLDDSLKARYLCLQFLIGVFKGGRSVAQILQKKPVHGTFYRECDIARAKRLSDFIFVHLRQVDDCIEPHINKNIKLEVRNIFRLVVAESTDKGTPDYAIVNSAVKLAKLNNRTYQLKSYYNYDQIDERSSAEGHSIFNRPKP